MGRPSEDKAKIEATRLAVLHAEQGKLRKRLDKEIRVKKAGIHLPGEEKHKKDLAVFLKIGVPGISFTEIANRLGETKGEVRKWFREDAEVKEFYDWALTNLKEGAIELMKTYSFEAIETLVLLMRFGSEKYMFEASKEILDRIGIAKVTRQEIESNANRSHEWSDRDSLVGEIRQLPPHLQEEAVDALEKFEELLASHSPDAQHREIENQDLDAIIDDDDEDED